MTLSDGYISTGELGAVAYTLDPEPWSSRAAGETKGHGCVAWLSSDPPGDATEYGCVAWLSSDPWGDVIETDRVDPLS